MLFPTTKIQILKAIHNGHTNQRELTKDTQMNMIKIGDIKTFGNGACYWSSTFLNVLGAHMFDVSDHSVGNYGTERATGFSVRCVKE